MGVTPIFIHKGAFSSKVKGVAQKIFRGLRLRTPGAFAPAKPLPLSAFGAEHDQPFPPSFATGTS